MTKEEWVAISDYEGLYRISSKGRVMSLNNGERIMAPNLNSSGYERVCLYKNGSRKFLSVHFLVARAFVPNPDGKPVIDHIDGNKRNNESSNLRWCTQKENCNFELAKKRRAESHKPENSPWFCKCGAEHPSSKTVAQYSRGGELIRTYDGLSEAARKTNINIGNISSCCRLKRKTAGGYIWKLND